MTNIKSIATLFVFAVMLVWGASAQELLTLEMAISEALAKNYAIKLERYNAEISDNNVSRSISGQMPQFEVSGSYEWGYTDAEIETLGEGDAPAPAMSLDGTSNDIFLAGELTVPIFQGFRGKYTFEQLQNSQSISQLQLRSVIEQTITQVVTHYLQVARLQTQLTIDESNISLSSDRWERKRIDAEFGASNSLGFLQSKVDLNTDSALYRTTAVEYENAKRNLNYILLHDGIDYQVREDLVLIDELRYETLLEKMKVSNTDLQISQRGLDNALLQTKIAQATKMPVLQGYANLQYLDSEDEANFLQSQTTLGPNVGVQLSYPLFTGGANRIQRQNARLSLDQQQVALESTETLLERDLQNAFAQYLNSKEQLRIERINLPTFEKNYQKVFEDYQLGVTDDTDVRSAQLNLFLAKNRINNLKYEVKQSEIRLLHLSGQLNISDK